MSRLSRFETLRGRRLGLAAVLLAGFCIFYPAIRAPLFLDDYLHVAMVEGTFAAKRGPLDLYDFVDDGDRALLSERGLLPWWSHPQLTIRFFRPLSSALLWAGHRVFSHSDVWLHLHSVAWWAAAVIAARALYSRFLSARGALLATAIFALSPCHALPLAWVANYEVLLALAFGALALSWQLRFRARAKLEDAARACLFFTLSILGGGEYALAFGGYVVAMELSVGRRSLLDRAHGVLPFFLPAGIYLAVRSLLHYGAIGSGFYTDPLRDPIAFLTMAPSRLLVLLANGWLTLGADGWRFGYKPIALACLAAVVVALLVVPVRRALSELATESNVIARTLLVGSLLSLAPTLAVVPSFRLLGASMIGVAGTVALLLEHAWFSRTATSGGASSRGAAFVNLAAILLGFSQLVHGPVISVLASRLHRRDGQLFAARAAWTAAMLGDPTRADVGVVRGLAGTFFLPFALDPQARTPERWRILAHTGHLLLLRQDERTFELVVAPDRSIYPIGEPNLYRPPGSPLRVGDTIRSAGMTVTVLDVGAVGPRRVRFVLDEAPEATTWIVDNFAAPALAALPSVGQGAPFDP